MSTSDTPAIKNSITDRTCSNDVSGEVIGNRMLCASSCQTDGNEAQCFPRKALHNNGRTKVEH